MLEPAYYSLLAKYGRLTSGFGWRKHPVTKRRGFHVGIDVAAPKGTTIKAWKSGKVESAGRLGLMGKCVIIHHPGGFVSVYGHCDEVLVKAGDKVRLGQKIAKVGKTGRATGTHLHFAIKRGGPLRKSFEISRLVMSGQPIMFRSVDRAESAEAPNGPEDSRLQ